MQWKPVLLRSGWTLFIVSLLMPAIQVAIVDSDQPEILWGLDFVLQSLRPHWWQELPLAPVVALANVLMFASLLFPGVSTRHANRTLALAVPCIGAAICALAVPSLVIIQIGFVVWWASLLCTGIGALLRLREEAA